jgi:hypothetical protein
LPLWWLAIVALLAATFMHRSPTMRSLATVMSVSSELVFAGLTLVTGRHRRAWWMSISMAVIWLAAAASEPLVQWLPVWTSLLVIIAIVVGSVAWYQLVLRQGKPETSAAELRQRKTPAR